jgi:hypothetical protein
MSGIDDREAAGRQPLIEELSVGERDDSVVAALMIVTGVAMCGSSLGECGQLLGASVAHIGANA